MYKIVKCYFLPCKEKKYISVECIIYSQAGRLWEPNWHQPWSGQKI